ncbi:MAG: polyribonucleotide nucleotidyltransferase [Pseudomonadota bacterium]
MKAVSIQFHGRTLSVEVGRVAKQANGSAYIKYGDTVILVTAVANRTEKEGQDFLPLTVDYFERYPAAGRIPGGFFKREGRQTERETLTSRLTDRPIRPLFPDNYQRETQVIATVLSFDKENDPDILALLGASTALQISEIPFHGPVAAVRVGRIEGQLVCNPLISQLATSDLDLVIAASRDAIVMVEGQANEVPEAEVLAAMKFGFESVQPLLDLQDELQKAVGKPKWVLKEVQGTKPLEDKIRSIVGGKLAEALKIKEKLPRYTFLADTKQELLAKLTAEDPSYADQAKSISETFSEIVSSEIRKRIVSTGTRVDQRDTKTVRPITIEVGLLPRTHGSALFTRGETQAIVTTTLGTSDDEQRIDSLSGEWRQKFMLHYNFPPFSVGECKPMRGPARREIGHGVLAHRAIGKILPKENFPYTIRVVSDILESHGSSSMATVCGATLSLMDAGVPIKAPVAGIAMGLIKEGDKFFVLSDISGDEDHIGDMDFKVAGTSAGVTAVQMDIKVRGIDWKVLENALHQAKEGRLHILAKMNEAISAPRPEMSPYAPRIETMQINVDKIREVIGPGGKMIRSICEQSGAKVDIEDSGIITIASADATALAKARELITLIVAEPEIGRIYKGKVARIMEYGAFVEIMPGTDGLVHISQIHSENGRVENVTDVLKEGDEIEVKVISVDRMGKIKLSHKEAIVPGSGNIGAEEEPRRRPPMEGRGRGGFGGGGGGRDRGRGGPGRGERDRGPRRDGPSQGGPRRDGPSQAGPSQAGPNHDAPREAGGDSEGSEFNADGDVKFRGPRPTR